VGLTPANALFDTADFYLQLEHFDPDRQVLETRLAAESAAIPEAFLDELAAGTATPGGGSAAAVAGAMAASLVHMGAELTIGRKQYAQVEAQMRQVESQADALKSRLSQLARDDMAAFDAVMQAYRLPRDTAEQIAGRTSAIQAALRGAIHVPLETARAGVETLRQALIVAQQGNVNAVSDAGAGAHLAFAAVRGAALNVLVNANSLQNHDEAQGYRDAIRTLEAEAETLLQEILSAVEERM
jgi:glutamate formiminotransferase/formiminotetrahydrofolate cyclodeaminase